MSALTLQQVLLLVGGAVLGGFIFGVAGFAFGVVASLLLHHAYDPKEVILIIVSCGVILSMASLPRFWREIRLRRAAPFLLGATLGLPLGLVVLDSLDADLLRAFVGFIIMAYCLFALTQSRRPAILFQGWAERAADTGVGFAGGLVGGGLWTRAPDPGRLVWFARMVKR